MKSPVAKHFRKFCKPSIQQSKRRQALMAASVQDEAEVLFEGEISQRNGDADHYCDPALDSEDSLCDISCSSISIDEGEEE